MSRKLTMMIQFHCAPNKGKGNKVGLYACSPLLATLYVLSSAAPSVELGRVTTGATEDETERKRDITGKRLQGSRTIKINKRLIQPCTFTWYVLETTQLDTSVFIYFSVLLLLLLLLLLFVCFTYDPLGLFKASTSNSSTFLPVLQGATQAHFISFPRSPYNNILHSALLYITEITPLYIYNSHLTPLDLKKLCNRKIN
eukprot:gene783-426_t